MATYYYPGSRHVSDPDFEYIQHLMFIFSAPGDSPPPLPRVTHGTVSDIRHDVVKTRVMVSDVHRDVSNTQTMVSDVHCDVAKTHTMVSDLHRDMLKSREGTDSQHKSVSDIRIPFHRRMNERSSLPRLKLVR